MVRAVRRPARIGPSTGRWLDLMSTYTAITDADREAMLAAIGV
jgi:hypothetical protein